MRLFQRETESQRVLSQKHHQGEYDLPLGGGWGQGKEAQVGLRTGTGNRNKNRKTRKPGFGSKN